MRDRVLGERRRPVTASDSVEQRTHCVGIHVVGPNPADAAVFLPVWDVE